MAEYVRSGAGSVKISRFFGSFAVPLAVTAALAGEPGDGFSAGEARIDQLATGGQNAGAGAVFSPEQDSATGLPATGGAFPRSILIPGTDTSIKIYGRINETAVYYFSGGNPNSSPPNTSVGVNGQVQAIPLHNSVGYARGNGIFLQSPRATRFGVETRTPTQLGEARTVVEIDWAGSNQFAPGGSNPTSVSDDLIPRLRYAYGTLGSLLVGQAASNFADPDANGEIIEFGGNVGEPGHNRIPQLRWTFPALLGGSFSVSAETPETVVATAGGVEGSDAGVIPTATTSCATGAPTSVVTSVATTCSTTLRASGTTPLNPAKATAPDFTAAFYMPEPWGHFDISGVVRPGIDVTDGKFISKEYVGYGGHFGADLRPGWFGWEKDDFILQLVGGDTIGSFVNSSTNFDLATSYGAPSTSSAAGSYGGFNGPTSATAAAAIIVKPTQEMGGELGYQHWWFDNLRSNLNAGWESHFGIPIKVVGASQAGSLNKELLTAHANLIWNPVSSVDLAVEYCWGQRTVLNNQTGTLNALITRMRISF